MELEVVDQEVACGDFSADLVARDLSRNRVVVIENQLEATDHAHLGQLITYAAALEATTVIWISREVREEHRQALDWLNRGDGAETEYFAVVLELLQIDGSNPAVNFRLVASPNDWSRQLKKSPANTEPTGRRLAYQAFFQQPVDEELRRAALKKLFADPHFNQMDMLDVYVDDYTQFEPLTAAMRLRLPSARAFLLDSERAALEAAEAATGAAGDVTAGSVAAAGEQCDPAASPDGSEERGLTAEDASVDSTSVDSTSALTAAPDLAPEDGRSAHAPACLADASSSHGGAPRKATAPDPSST
jgi:hypothetical protein